MCIHNNMLPRVHATVYTNILMVADDDMKKVDKNIVKRSHNLWFEAKLILSSQKDAKKVYCYISPKVKLSHVLLLHVEAYQLRECLKIILKTVNVCGRLINPRWASTR